MHFILKPLRNFKQEKLISSILIPQLAGNGIEESNPSLLMLSKMVIFTKKWKTLLFTNSLKLILPENSLQKEEDRGIYLQIQREGYPKCCPRVELSISKSPCLQTSNCNTRVKDRLTVPLSSGHISTTRTNQQTVLSAQEKICQTEACLTLKDEGSNASKRVMQVPQAA